MKFVLVCSCAAFVLASGCSSDKNASVAETTPATATTSTAAPSQTSSPVAPTTSKAPATTESAPDVTAERVTAPPTSKAPTSTSTSVAEPSGGDEYMPADPPAVIDQTHEILPDNTRPDGVYYATVSEGGDPPPADGSVVFELVQLFIGENCIAHFGRDDADTCLNDYGVETDPTSYVEVPLTNQFITVVDSATQQSYRVSGAELYRLIQGEEPAEGAPPDYFYSGFGYFVTVANGEVTRLEQWWTP